MIVEAKRRNRAVFANAVAKLVFESLGHQDSVSRFRRIREGHGASFPRRRHQLNPVGLAKVLHFYDLIFTKLLRRFDH